MTNFDFLLSSPDIASLWEATTSKNHSAKLGKTGNLEIILDAALLWVNICQDGGFYGYN